MEDWLQTKGYKEEKETTIYISLLQLVTGSMRVGVLTRRITACKHCRCKRISSARQKHIWRESGWNGLDCLKHS